MLVMLGKVAAGGRGSGCGVRRFVPLAAGRLADTGFLTKLGALLATVIVGALVFAGCGAALHVEELKELQGAIRRRLRRTR